MLPGPTLLYACPKCGQKIANESLMSGNTFGARYFSDGKRIAPMLPEFPDLIRCQSCGFFFFLHEQEPVDELYRFDDQFDFDLSEIDQAQAPGLDDLVLALREEVARKKENEIAIRMDIWRAFNDRSRNGN
jgi:DNA-directed RNA polymerase subunit RPC12/RpoP